MEWKSGREKHLSATHWKTTEHRGHGRGTHETNSRRAELWRETRHEQISNWRASWPVRTRFSITVVAQWPSLIHACRVRCQITGQGSQWGGPFGSSAHQNSFLRELISQKCFAKINLCVFLLLLLSVSSILCSNFDLFRNFVSVFFHDLFWKAGI